MDRSRVESGKLSAVSEEATMVETYLCVRMSGKQHALREFLSAYPNEPRGIRREGDLVTFQVFIPEDLLPKAAKFANVERLYNATEVGIARQSQVGKGNRFKKGEIPHGIGLGG